MDIIKNAGTFQNDRIYFKYCNIANITIITVVRRNKKKSLFGLDHFHKKFTAG